MAREQSIQITPLSPALGAQIDGVSITGSLSTEVVAEIRDAFLKHIVLVFRGQGLSPTDQMRFTEHFGEVRPHPLNTRRHVEGFPAVLVLENRPGRRGARNDYWHSDISHLKDPPWVTLLHARKIPSGRGDTMFCNMYNAYESLSDGMRGALDSMKALHSAAATMTRSHDESSDARPIPPSEVVAPNAHPVVIKHPESGRRALFVNPHFTTAFDGLTVQESQPWLQFLYAHSTRPENIYRHRWEEGDVVIWDNRCAMHYAIRDYDESMERLMHRTTGYGSPE